MKVQQPINNRKPNHRVRANDRIRHELKKQRGSEVSESSSLYDDVGSSKIINKN